MTDPDLPEVYPAPPAAPSFPPPPPPPSPFPPPAASTFPPLSAAYSPASTYLPGAANPEPPRRSNRRALVAIGAAVVAIALAAGVFVLPMLTTTPALPGAAPKPANTGISTTTPTSQPGNQAVLNTGGDLGRAIDFRTGTGTGQITVTKATWTSAGRMAPPAASQYLVVEIRVTCTEGTLFISPLSFTAGADPAQGASFGPELANQLGSAELSAGAEISGELGFVRPTGQTSLVLLDSQLKQVATVVVPAP